MPAENNLKPTRTLCTTCYRSVKACLCQSITTQKTLNRFVILMHPLEFKNQRTGTGRMSHLGLANSELIVGVDFTHHKRVNEIIGKEDTVLLYPGQEALNLSTQQPQHQEPQTIFLIDSTWPCAKKILRLSKNLHTLKRICFHSKKISEFVIKQQPNPDCLSTIEALQTLIEVLQSRQLENADFNHKLFLKPFYQMIEFQMACAINPDLGGYRRKPYKDVNVRIDPQNRRKLYHD